MSARNSHAAKAARRKTRGNAADGTLTHKPLTSSRKDAIADAVHQAVSLVFGDDGIGHCDGYAISGSIVLSRITGQDWIMQAGEARFGTGNEVDSPEGEICYSFVPSETSPAQTLGGRTATVGGLANGEFHAWCVRGKSNGQVAEVADFSARHVPVLADRVGIGWARERMAYAWGTHDDLWRDRFMYTPDLQTIETIMRHFSGCQEPYKDVVTLALWKLGIFSDQRAKELIHDERWLWIMQEGFTVVGSPGDGIVAVRLQPPVL